MLERAVLFNCQKTCDLFHLSILPNLHTEKKYIYIISLESFQSMEYGWPSGLRLYPLQILNHMSMGIRISHLPHFFAPNSFHNSIN